MLIPHPPALPGNKSAPEGMGQIANYECFPLRTISPTVLGCSRSDLVITCSTLPDGLSLDNNTGDITGPPTTAGSAVFDITVTDDIGTLAVATLSIQIDPASVDPSITSVTPSTASAGDRLTIVISGNNFEAGALVSMGPKVIVKSVTRVSATELSVSINVKKKASSGTVDVTVTNPSGGNATLVSGFTIL